MEINKRRLNHRSKLNSPKFSIQSWMTKVLREGISVYLLAHKPNGVQDEAGEQLWEWQAKRVKSENHGSKEICFHVALLWR